MGSIYDSSRPDIGEDEPNLVAIYVSGEGKISCEGFKFTQKIKAETKKDCSSLIARGYKISEEEYEWELTKPADSDFFDKRWDEQKYDPYSMDLTAFYYDQKGNLVEKETFVACFITDLGREYDGAIQPTIKGKSLGKRLPAK